MTTELTAKERALVGISAAIASGCQPCTAKFVEAARAAGACERSIRLAIEIALAERQQATNEMAEWAKAVQGTIPVVDDSFRVEKRRNAALFASVAAHAVHATATLGANVAQALELGWSATQIEAGFGIGRSVAKVASEKADSAIRNAGIDGENSRTSCHAGFTEQRVKSPAGTSGCGCTGC